MELVNKPFPANQGCLRDEEKSLELLMTGVEVYEGKNVRL